MKEKNYLCNRIQQAEPTILCHVNSTFIYPHNFMCNPANQFFVGAQEMPSNAETVISGIQKTRTYQPCCQCYLEKCTRLHPVNKQRLQSAENELLPTDRNTKRTGRKKSR